MSCSHNLTMLSLIRRYCFRKVCSASAWIIIGLMCLYIYVVALYFLYATTDRIQKGVHGDSPPVVVKSGPLYHDHDLLKGPLPDGVDKSKFRNLAEVMVFRQKRFAEAQARPRSSGPGENGAPVVLSEREQLKADQLFQKEAFNIIASDKIALNRSIADNRDPGCKDLKYPEKLPNASVIIIFHNEAWSPLLRTAHSVVNRSPPQYLHEVILLDDFSDRPELGEKLEKYVKDTWPDGVVKLVRTKERSGLIRARLAGAEAATGDVLIFLDSHCECNTQWLEPLLARIKESRSAVLCPMIDVIDAHKMSYNGIGAGSVGGFWWSLHFSWRPLPQRERERREHHLEPYRLEPLLARIKENRSAVLCPMIDSISDKTLEFSRQGGLAVGGFTWSLHFTWRAVPPSENVRRKYPTDPARSPTMAGGLFAVNREYFFEIGAYDPGMDVWGGENLEISFRTWMCGGTLEFVPCSRVGHIFRASHPYTFPGHKDTHGLNSKRLAEVWMDEYKRLFYHHRRDLVNKDAGDFSDRIQLRNDLKCNSFKWYLEKVYPEKFIPDENVYAFGMVRNPASNICLDILNKDEKTTFNVGLFSCQGGISANQIFSLSKKNELRREESCMDAFGLKGSKVTLMPCHGHKGNQEWKYSKENKTITHASGLCLDKAEAQNNGEVVVNPCDGKDSQKWEFEHLVDL